MSNIHPGINETMNGHAQISPNGYIVTGTVQIKFRRSKYLITLCHDYWKVTKLTGKPFYITSDQRSYHLTNEIELLLALCKRMTDPIEMLIAKKIKEAIGR